jgi:hypothetical protein
MSNKVGAIALRMAINKPASRSINFKYKGISLRSTMYNSVLSALESGRAKTVVGNQYFKDDPEAGAFYRADTNTFFFRENIYDSTVLKPSMLETLIHEATHCAFDLNKISMQKRISETIAAMAGLVYRFNLMGGNNFKTLVAPRLAQKIINNQNIDLSKDSDMNWLDWLTDTNYSNSKPDIKNWGDIMTLADG